MEQASEDILWDRQLLDSCLQCTGPILDLDISLIVSACMRISLSRKATIKFIIIYVNDTCVQID